MTPSMKKGHSGRKVFGEAYLPERPHAADQLGPMRTMTKQQALTKRNIQVNATRTANLLTVDIDDRLGGIRALEDSHGLSPMWVAEGVNGHAHAAWRIQTPVITVGARQQPVYYARDAQEGLRRKCGGDPGYTGYMTKNPLSEDWDVIWGTEKGLEGYTLNELQSWLEDAGFWPENGWHRKEPPATSLGRNCTIFDETRKWAYRECKKHAPDLLRFGEVVENYALSVNMMMYEDNPLSTAEVLGIARSITRWIAKRPMWTGRYEELPKDYREMKGRQGRAGMASRWGDPAARDARVRQLIEGYGNDA